MKFKKKLMLVLAVITMMSAVALAGCGSKNDEQKVAAVVKLVQNELQSTKTGYEDMMNIEIEARGSSIAYVYTYKVDIGDLNTAKTGLASQKSTLESTMKPVVQQLKDQKISNPSVIVEYKAKDGTMIYSLEIK